MNRAKGDASRFTSIATEYAKAPDATRTRIYIEAMEALLLDVSKLTIVDSGLKGLLPIFGSVVEGRTHANPTAQKE